MMGCNTGDTERFQAVNVREQCGTNIVYASQGELPISNVASIAGT